MLRQLICKVGYSTNRVYKDFLQQLTRDSIPKSLYELQFSRSSGPGGQHVNKASTKATLIMNSSFLQYLPAAILDQVMAKNVKYLNRQKDKMIIYSDLTRSKQHNIDDCFKKLSTAINEAVHFDSPELALEYEKKWQKIKLKTNEKRLADKKRNKERKASRKNFME